MERWKLNNSCLQSQKIFRMRCFGGFVLGRGTEGRETRRRAGR